MATLLETTPVGTTTRNVGAAKRTHRCIIIFIIFTRDDRTTFFFPPLFFTSKTLTPRPLFPPCVLENFVFKLTLSQRNTSDNCKQKAAWLCVQKAENKFQLASSNERTELRRTHRARQLRKQLLRQSQQ